MTKANIFLDANLALHFRRPDQIDWLALAAAREVALVAAPILLRELEYQKVHNRSVKLRERSGAWIKWLSSFARAPDTKVRENVRWLFLTNEPQIDFAVARLSPTLADDQLIASALDHAATTKDRVLVATADLGLEVMVRSRGIGLVTLADDLRLPEERDAREEEFESLRREVARLKARTPTLAATFQDGEQHFALRLCKPREINVASLAQIKAQYPPMSKAAQTSARTDTPREQLLRDMVFAFGVSDEQIEAYNQAVSEYFGAYGRYQAAVAVWREDLPLHAPVDIVISNDGTAPASSIDLLLDFPDGVTPVPAEDLPKEPTPPEPPSRPRGFADLLHAPRRPDFSLFAPHDMDLGVDRRYDGEANILPDERSVKFNVASLKHRFKCQCDQFLIRFRERSAVRAFSVRYDLSAAELPEAIVGDLHLRVVVD